ncbi:MAG: cytidylate kinase family protein [Candidatus Aenigmarchaeota archaeon]|nr:cytidylate kinase family protein [Candidatus Aenigmarchaeota archaeon]
MAMTIIVSGMAGSGKTTLARMLAKRYGLKYISGGDALKEFAAKKGYACSGAGWWETEEGIRFVEERIGNPAFDKEVDRCLEDKIGSGGFSITSVTLPWLGVKGVKVWLSATQDTRAERIMGRDKSSFENALKAVKIRDVKNCELYKKMYGYVFGKDFDVFDLIVDTDGKTLAEVEKVIVEYIGKMGVKDSTP